jgi:3-isopropylmalate dehydrogenase
MSQHTIKIVLLNGDGVGPEVVLEARKSLEILNSFTQKHLKSLVFEEKLIGGCAIDVKGNPLPQDTLEACRNAHAILLGAVGGPKWPSKTNPQRPEQGLLKIRKELDLFANIRPCFFPAKSLVERSPLRPEIVEGVEFTVVRELTGGIYFGDRVEETAEGIGKSYN